MRPCFHLIKSKPPNAEKLNGAVEWIEEASESNFLCFRFIFAAFFSSSSRQGEENFLTRKNLKIWTRWIPREAFCLCLFIPEAIINYTDN